MKSLGIRANPAKHFKVWQKSTADTLVESKKMTERQHAGPITINASVLSVIVNNSMQIGHINTPRSGYSIWLCFLVYLDGLLDWNWHTLNLDKTLKIKVSQLKDLGICPPAFLDTFTISNISALNSMYSSDNCWCCKTKYALLNETLIIMEKCSQKKCG